ncbi:TetR/AcrR family transcriptional regulator [Parahaliea mediterranea]|uniref:TetR/AcrR family transcriptional regulator n=1 Tax=Parahaliea mediterranea TaxID=651086 RepID=A0A939DEB9_9GAMM|nr:TetR/AcrR family transcriptional regulator [Parahaliea mediterranea]MBN7796549.1 TetR/AcrR family transcriptional regulator [Parahaliea mediterranea]
MEIIRFSDLLAAQANALGGKRNSPHTKLRIQTETARLLEASGYDSLSMSAICEQVGLTRRALYLHYKNKEEIVLDLSRALFKAEAQLAPSLTDCKNLAEAIYKVCRWYVHFHLGSGALYTTLMEIRRPSMEARELWAARTDNLLGILIYQYKQFKEFREVDPDWAVFCILSVARAINATVDRIGFSPEPENVRQYCDRIDEEVVSFSKMMYQTLVAKPWPLASG